MDMPAPRTHHRVRIRPAIALCLLVIWPLVPITALIAHVQREAAERGWPGRGGVGAWTEVHWWLGIAAVAVTATHLVVNWPIVKAQLRRLFR